MIDNTTYFRWHSLGKNHRLARLYGLLGLCLAGNSLCHAQIRLNTLLPLRSPISTHLPDQGSQKADPNYRVGVGDWLLVKLPDYDQNHPVEVRPDGKISIDRNINIRADGLTCGQIVRQIVRQLGPELEKTEVRVASYNSRFIFVYGFENAGRPTVVSYRGRETVAELISRVGCISCMKGYRVRVVRASNQVGGKPHVFAIRLSEDLADRDGNGPVFLQPQDYVYIDKDQGRGSLLSRLTSRLTGQSPEDDNSHFDESMFKEPAGNSNQSTNDAHANSAFESQVPTRTGIRPQSPSSMGNSPRLESELGRSNASQILTPGSTHESHGLKPLPPPESLPVNDAPANRSALPRQGSTKPTPPASSSEIPEPDTKPLRKLFRRLERQ